MWISTQVMELQQDASPRGLPALQRRLTQPSEGVPVQQPASGDEVWECWLGAPCGSKHAGLSGVSAVSALGSRSLSLDGFPAMSQPDTFCSTQVALVCLCSGPGQVMELELDTTPRGIRQLLDFLSGGFTGGTDVDKPLELSLKRLTDVGWTQVSCPSMWGGASAESPLAAHGRQAQP